MADMLRRNCSRGCCLVDNRSAEKRRVEVEIAEHLEEPPRRTNGTELCYCGFHHEEER